MGIIRDSFVIFKNWVDAINSLPNKYQLECYKALVEYGMSGEMPEHISPTAKALLISFSVGMENNVRRYVASVENGKKGGRPPKNKPNENLEKPKITQQYPNETNTNQHEPTHNLNDNDNVNVNVNKERKEINKEKIFLSLEKFKKVFPKKSVTSVEDVNLEGIDIDLLIEKINQSDFLKKCNNIDFSWCLKNYSLIIQDKYKDFAKNDNLQNFQERNYSSEDFNGLFDSLDDVEIN